MLPLGKDLVIGRPEGFSEFPGTCDFAGCPSLSGCHHMRFIWANRSKHSRISTLKLLSFSAAISAREKGRQLGQSFELFCLSHACLGCCGSLDGLLENTKKLFMISTGSQSTSSKLLFAATVLLNAWASVWYGVRNTAVDIRVQ